MTVIHDHGCRGGGAASGLFVNLLAIRVLQSASASLIVIALESPGASKSASTLLAHRLNPSLTDRGVV